jgi:hypothetical protein
VAVDGAHVYWANVSTNSIGRSNLDGNPASVDQSFITGASSPRGVAVDGANVYWANVTTGTIGRSNLNGSGADQNFIAGASFPRGVAVDALAPPPPPPPLPSLPPPFLPAPVISSARLSSNTFAAADRGASLTARRKKKRRTGTDVSYRNSQAAVTTFTVLKPVAGHKKGRRCLAGAPRRGQKRCTRSVSVGSFTHRDRAGNVKVHFNGRVRGRKLSPGSYLLALTPSANGKTGRAVTLSFRIIQ